MCPYRYIGQIPENDVDNPCRALLAEMIQDQGCFYEIHPEKLYIVELDETQDPKKFCETKSSDTESPFIFWGTHQRPLLSYENFAFDFGPYNLANLHSFCAKLKIWFDTQEYRSPDKYVVIVLGCRNNQETRKKLNVTFAVAVAAMVLLGMTDQEFITRLESRMVCNLKSGDSMKLVFKAVWDFREVSATCRKNITLNDCISAFYAAIQSNFYNFYTFDPAEYLFYETVMTGDLNWILPGKILAFATPAEQEMARSEDGFKHPPEFYYQYFKDHNVTDIIRLNDATYRASSFNEQGFKHHDLIFPDGTHPTYPIAAKFIKIVDEAEGAVAVHCFAGIGRTGTLIAAYISTRFDFTPRMAIAWTRICRPGSVIGPQQIWLFKLDKKAFNENPSNHTVKSQNTRQLSQEEAAIDKTDLESTDATYITNEKNHGQAKALSLVKTKRYRDKHEKIKTKVSMILAKDDALKTSVTDETVTRKKELDLGKTVPMWLLQSDIARWKKTGKLDKIKYYHVRDGKYIWRVKFPRYRYVSLKYILCDKLEEQDLNDGEPSPIAIDFDFETETEGSHSKGSDKVKSSGSRKSGYSGERRIPVLRIPVYL